MTRRLMMVLTATVLCFSVPRLFAHEHYRVVGTITKHEKSSIIVKDKNSKLMTVYLDKKTKITKDKKKVPVTDLKVGTSVVVDAYGDGEDDLLALDIMIVPPIGAKK
jgi:hypothetical protein